MDGAWRPPMETPLALCAGMAGQRTEDPSASASSKDHGRLAPAGPGRDGRNIHPRSPYFFLVVLSGESNELPPNDAASHSNFARKRSAPGPRHISHRQRFRRTLNALCARIPSSFRAFAPPRPIVSVSQLLTARLWRSRGRGTRPRRCAAFFWGAHVVASLVHQEKKRSVAQANLNDR